MIAQTVTLDKEGRLPLPAEVREAMGIKPDDKLVLRLVDKKLVVEAQPVIGPITRHIAAMDLPIADWETMEQEVEQGRLS